jgi:hypothetical protein
MEQEGVGGPAYAKILDSDVVELNGCAILRLKFAMIGEGGVSCVWADLPIFHKDHEAEYLGRSSAQALAQAMEVCELEDSKQLHNKLFAIYKSAHHNTMEVRRATNVEKAIFKDYESKLKAVLKEEGELPRRDEKLPSRLRKFLPVDAEDLFA